jgi:hypothetical protein
MTDLKQRFTPLSPAELAPRDDELFDRSDLAKRWKCSEKAVQRIEKRHGLPGCRIMRAVKYRLSDILRVEAEGLDKLPKRWTGLRPDQKIELLHREREELS